MYIFDKFITDTVEKQMSGYEGLFEDPEDVADTLGFMKVYKVETPSRFVPLSYSTPIDLYVLGLTIYTQAVVDFYRSLGLK